MIAKYNGKCDLTGNPIVAGQTEIGRIAPFTVLAEYASPEAVEAWFAARVAEVEALAAEMAQVRGRENTIAASFRQSLDIRRGSALAHLQRDAEWVRNEIAGIQRRLDMARQRA